MYSCNPDIELSMFAKKADVTVIDFKFKPLFPNGTSTSAAGSGISNEEGMK